MKPLKAWALVVTPTVRGEDRIAGGQVRCAIYWTRSSAKKDAPNVPGCRIVPVLVRPLKGATDGE